MSLSPPELAVAAPAARPDASAERTNDAKTLTVVIPVFNEEGNLDALTARLRDALTDAGVAYSLLFVDDGSRDGTLMKLRRLAEADPHVQALALSRNFGKEAAIAASLPKLRLKARRLDMGVGLGEAPDFECGPGHRATNSSE